MKSQAQQLFSFFTKFFMPMLTEQIVTKHFILLLQETGFVTLLVKGKCNIPGTACGPGGRDRTLAIKSRKIMAENLFFSRKK